MMMSIIAGDVATVTPDAAIAKALTFIPSLWHLEAVTRIREEWNVDAGVDWVVELQVSR